MTFNKLLIGIVCFSMIAGSLALVSFNKSPETETIYVQDESQFTVTSEHEINRKCHEYKISPPSIKKQIAKDIRILLETYHDPLSNNIKDCVKLFEDI